jgi:putative ABC transport system ATP-binding protein
MYSAPRKLISFEELARDNRFLDTVFEHGIGEQAIAISQTVIEELHLTFGRDGTEHPLFQMLGINVELYEQLVDIATRRREKGDDALTELEFAKLLTVPFAFTAEQIGPSFPDTFKREIVEIRKRYSKEMQADAAGLFVPLDPETYISRLSLVENALFGRISIHAGNKAEAIVDVVAEIFTKHGLRRRVAQNVFDLTTGLGGSNMPAVFHERAGFARAAIKRPDILILDRALASHDADQRRDARFALRELMPEATMIFIEDKFQFPNAYDMYIEIKNGRIDGVKEAEEEEDFDATTNMRTKLRAIGEAELFAKLDAKSQRLLAFSASWFKAKPGEKIFGMNERADAAFLCVSGEGSLYYEDEDGTAHHVTTVSPGRLIGDLSIILDEPRMLGLTAVTEAVFLRIGAREFRAVMENDVGVLLSLLQTVSSHLTGAAEMLRQANVRVSDTGVTFEQTPD